MNKKSRIKIVKAINNHALIKQADVFSYLSSYFSSMIDKNNPHESILNILGTGIATGLFGLTGGAFAAILNEAGINLSALVKYLGRTIKSFFETNPTITNENIDSIAEDLAKKTIQGSNISQEALQTELTSSAFELSNITKTSGVLPHDWEHAVKSNWILKNLFSYTAKKSIGGFLFAFLIVLIKALFVGGGLTLGAGYIASKIRGNGPATSQPETSEPKTETKQTAEPQSPKEKRTTLLDYIKSITSPSGNGELVHKNDADQNNNGDYAWYVPSSGNLSRTIYNWIFDVYPNIPDNIETIISQNYQKAVSPLLDTIQKWNTENVNQIPEVRIPNNFLTRKQIVDYILSSFTINNLSSL